MHKTKMTLTKVFFKPVDVIALEAFDESRQDSFPFCGDAEWDPTYPIYKTHAKIYVCPKCVAARDRWQKTQNTLKIKLDYLRQVVLSDVNARYYTLEHVGKVPGISFKIQNQGLRTLKEVEITVSFKDRNNTIIHEDKIYPLSTFCRSTSKKTRLLKPNGTWQTEKGGYCYIKSVPPEWKPGAVSAQITNIEFE